MLWSARLTPVKSGDEEEGESLSGGDDSSKGGMTGPMHSPFG